MSTPLSLFEGYGIELEYMIVSEDDLCIMPIADEILRDANGTGEIVGDLERGPFGWSNELVAHVLEIKTNGPTPDLVSMATGFQAEIAEANRIAHQYGACLLPTAAHPWMNPFTETRLWPHDCSEIYQAFNRIFDCRGHGWSNLQSMHINLPFQGDEEFARLHAAIRLLMPIMPALSASSPFLDGKATGLIDSRLAAYQKNCARIPLITGKVIPEVVQSESDYYRTIFQPMWQAIKPFDHDNILQEEWLNARGAIARFGRGTIEIRVLDLQECPAADLAIAIAISSVLKAMCNDQFPLNLQNQIPENELSAILDDVIKNGGQTQINHPDFLANLGVESSCSAAEIWSALINQYVPAGDHLSRLKIITSKGTLAERLLDAHDSEINRESLYSIYGQLTHCLKQGTMFEP